MASPAALERYWDKLRRREVETCARIPSALAQVMCGYAPTSMIRGAHIPAAHSAHDLGLIYEHHVATTVPIIAEIHHALTLILRNGPSLVRHMRKRTRELIVCEFRFDDPSRNGTRDADAINLCKCSINGWIANSGYTLEFGHGPYSYRLVLMLW
jgi:hypothetical protein